MVLGYPGLGTGSEILRLRFEDEETSNRSAGAELEEQRGEVHVDGQAVIGGAAEHDRHGRRSAQGTGPESVQEPFEQAGVGGLIGGAGQHENVGGEHSLDGGDSVRVRGIEGSRAEDGEIDLIGFGAFGQRGGEGAHQRAAQIVRSRLGARITDDPEDGGRGHADPARGQAKESPSAGLT